MEKKWNRYFMVLSAIGICSLFFSGTGIKASEEEQTQNTENTLYTGLGDSQEEIAYIDFLNTEGYSSDMQHLDGITYAGYDVNADGKQEMIIKGYDMENVSYKYAFYYYDDNKVCLAGTLSNWQNGGNGEMYYVKRGNGVVVNTRLADRLSYTLYQINDKVKENFTINRRSLDVKNLFGQYERKYAYDVYDEYGDPIGKRITDKDWTEFENNLEEITFYGLAYSDAYQDAESGEYEENTDSSESTDSAEFEDGTEGAYDVISADEIDDAREYYDDLAFILFWENSRWNKGFIDKSGNLKFYVPVDDQASDEDIYRYWVDFDNGYNWFEYDGKFYVIDTDGNITSQYDAEDVVEYGAGYTWIETEEEVSWDNAGFHKYVLYNPQGDEAAEYCIDSSYFDGSWSFGLSYIGGGIFAYETPDKSMLYDTNLLSEIELDVDYDKVTKYGINNGIIVSTGAAVNDGYWASEENPFILILIKDGIEEKIEIPSKYLGDWGGYPTLLDWSNQYALLVTEKDDDDLFFVYDMETQEVNSYSGKYDGYLKYFSNTDYAVWENILAIYMKGADGNDYVGMINANTMEEIGNSIELVGDDEGFWMKNGVLLVNGKDLYDLDHNFLWTVDENATVKDIGQDTILLVNDGEEETGFYYRKFDGTRLFSEVNTSGSKMLIEPMEDDW